MGTVRNLLLRIFDFLGSIGGFDIHLVPRSQYPKGPSSLVTARNVRHAQTPVTVCFLDRFVLPAAVVDMPPLDAVHRVGCDIDNVATVLARADESKPGPVAKARPRGRP